MPRPMPPGAWFTTRVRNDGRVAYVGHSQGQAAIDAVLYYLYGKPSVAAERLITDITSKGIFG